MKQLCLAVVVLFLCSLSIAGTLSNAVTPNKQQSQAASARKNAEVKQASPTSPDDSTSCSFNFSSGANNTFLSYCVSSNGNVLNVVTPAGQQHIFAREGYGVCDINSGTEYFDYGFTGASTNWQPGIVLSQGANKVKIARTTIDGVWTLTQTIMQVPSSSSIKVTMTMKNNTAVSREIQLSRFADIDADGVTSNTIDSTINDAMIFNSVGRGNSFGLALQNVGTSPFTYLGFVRNTDSIMSPCNPFTNQAIGPLVNTDGTAIMTYVITIPAGASKTVNVGYRGL